jgi:hypothetical protein
LASGCHGIRVPANRNRTTAPNVIAAGKPLAAGLISEAGAAADGVCGCRAVVWLCGFGCVLSGLVLARVSEAGGLSRWRVLRCVRVWRGVISW